MTRNIKAVQTPGEPVKVEAPAAEQDTATTNTESGEQANVAAADADAGETQAVAAEAAAPAVDPNAISSAPAKKAKAVDYSKLRAHEIDPKKITQSVLSADGWVVPASA